MTGRMTFAEEPGLSRRCKQSKRERYFVQVDVVVPWSRSVALVVPHYPKAGHSRRTLERMLRIHFLQLIVRLGQLVSIAWPSAARVGFGARKFLEFCKKVKVTRWLKGLTVECLRRYRDRGASFGLDQVLLHSLNGSLLKIQGGSFFLATSNLLHFRNL